MPDFRKSLFNLSIAARAARSRSHPRRVEGTTHVFLCVVDHFEPQVGRPGREKARERMEDWLQRYPKIARGHRDCEGRPAVHSFFYPWDEFDPWELERLGELCAEGAGEVDLHLHHRDDTEATLREKLQEAILTYDAAGLLPRWPDGRPAWGFIHGDWALDNSRCEHGRNFCGVNNELTVLQQEGCYADFTFPAWRHWAQPRQVNSLYYAVDDPVRAKSYDRGCRARVGETDPSGLLILQGPLVPHRRSRGFGVDDGDLAASRRYSPARLDRWVETGIHVQGRPDRIFIKLHSHGAEDRNRETLLGRDLDALYADAEARYNDGRRFRLHYVSAREMYNAVKCTEAGRDDWRTWPLPPAGSRAQPARIGAGVAASAR